MIVMRPFQLSHTSGLACRFLNRVSATESINSSFTHFSQHLINILNTCSNPSKCMLHVSAYWGGGWGGGANSISESRQMSSSDFSCERHGHTLNDWRANGCIWLFSENLHGFTKSTVFRKCLFSIWIIIFLEQRTRCWISLQIWKSSAQLRLPTTSRGLRIQ